MTITLELNSAVEGYLKTQASAQGISVEAFVVTILETLMANAMTQPLSPEKRAEAFVNWAKSHSFDAPPLSFQMKRSAGKVSTPEKIVWHEVFVATHEKRMKRIICPND